MASFPFPRVPLEDEAIDIIGKAQRGLALGNRGLAEKAGLSDDDCEAIQSGRAGGEALRKAADALGLNAAALAAVAQGEWYPNFPDAIDGVAMCNTPFDDMTTNAYVVWSPATRDAFILDTGTDAAALLDVCSRNELRVRAILLTHTHHDHIAVLPQLRKETGAPVFVNEHESVPGTEPFSEGKVFEAGDLRLETRLTSGHSPGGTTFVVSGLSMPIAVTGDSIFAGSMGGGMISFSDQKRNIAEKILTLSDETVLFPGHGPPTTVAQEKKHNPFFA